MEITGEEVFELIAALWADEYPLTRKYFGEHLARLLRAVQDGANETYFARVALRPQVLEATLQRIENFGQTQGVMSEIGNIGGAERLNGRLMNAWAELRVIDQLRKEGFDSIEKVTVTGDLTAQKDGQALMFQVTRINRSWTEQISEHSVPGVSVDSIAWGDIGDIYRRLSRQLHKRLTNRDEADESEEYGPLSYFFWDTILDKNSDLKKLAEADSRRCLVIVSNEAGLQDPMVRHVACCLIRVVLHEWLRSIHFEELLWLPDPGNGAWFRIGPTIGETRCLADWSDGPGRDSDTVCRSEVDLDSVLPSEKK